MVTKLNTVTMAPPVRAAFTYHGRGYCAVQRPTSMANKANIPTAARTRSIAIGVTCFFHGFRELSTLEVSNFSHLFHSPEGKLSAVRTLRCDNSELLRSSRETPAVICSHLITGEIFRRSAYGRSVFCVGRQVGAGSKCNRVR